MKTRFIVLTCAIMATGCGSSITQPAQDPASSTTVATPSDSDAATATQPLAARPNKEPESTTTADRAAGPSNASSSATAPTVPSSTGHGDQTRNADNTKTINRDRSGALTPMDQGNSGSETTITSSIRKGIMANGSLSFNAKNAKVITIGNKVTLRGPVKSEQERASVEAIARQTPGVSEVDNQLEVKK